MKNIKELKEEIVNLKIQVAELNSIDNQNREDHKKIFELLTPICDTYKLVGVMGKWLMAILVFVSISLGIILSWAKIKELFK